jgi:nucleoside-diphosphate-sugar epimerase
MRVFVAGGTGAIGGRLIPQLVMAGHDVVATTRSTTKLDHLRELGAEAVVADGLDGAAVGSAVADAEPDVIIHQMTALAGSSDLRRFDRTFATTNRLRTAGTDNLLAAAQAVGVQRIIVASFTGWPNERVGSSIKTEDDPLDPTPPAQQRETLAAIRYLEQTVVAAPLDGVVLRYGSLYGPGTSDEILAVIRKRGLPIVGAGNGVWSMIHIDDAAAATAAAVDRGSGSYNIVDDDPAPARELITEIAEIVGAQPPRHVPTWLARIVAGEVPVSMLTRIRGSSNAKAKRELGWAPKWSSWRDGFRYGMSDDASARR